MLSICKMETAMKFGEKVRYARRQLGLSREALSEITGISVRAIAYYELEGKLPKQRAYVEALAKAFGVDAAQLTDDGAELTLGGDSDAEQGRREAQRIVKQIKALYSGGSLNRKDIDAMMLAIQDAYWIARRKMGDDREEGPDD